MSQEPQILNMLRDLSIRFFGIDIDQNAAARGHEFWSLEIDSDARRFRDMRGNIDQESMRLLNQKFVNSDAGFRASAQVQLGLQKKVDIFLVNKEHVNKSEADFGPVLVHEICHFIDQVNARPDIAFDPVDIHNGKVILKSYHADVLALHDVIWANLMSWAARKAVMDFGETSIASYIEKAIPSYDRIYWNAQRVREMSAPEPEE